MVKLLKVENHTKCQKEQGIYFSSRSTKEVDKDSIRFMMLNRSNDVELDFDFDKVKESQKTILYFMFNMHMQELTQF